MASYHQTYYCKNCKTNVGVNQDGLCQKCGNSSFNKSWAVRFRINELTGEKQKCLSGYKTKREAQQAYTDFIINYIPLENLNTQTFIFDDLLKEYYLNCNTQNSDSTIYDKKHTFDLYIKPFFKGKDISKLTKSDFLHWQNYLWSLKNPKTNKQYSWKYLTKIRGNLYNFLSYCENIYDIPNRLRTLQLPKNMSTKKDISFWELDTFNTFIESVKEIEWKTMWYVFMYTGARFNEVRALSDNDIKNNRITINKSLNGKKVYNNDNPIKPTKNYRAFTKQIPVILQETITEYKTWKRKNNIPSKYLFGGEIPYSENVVRRRLKDDIEKAKVPYISPHGFRHSYVSLLINLGVTTKVIAELIGDREEQVIKTYGHLYANAKDNAIEILNQKLLSA